MLAIDKIKNKGKLKSVFQIIFAHVFFINLVKKKIQLVLARIQKKSKYFSFIIELNDNYWNDSIKYVNNDLRNGSVMSSLVHKCINHILLLFIFTSYERS
jgi:hypothetical protein